MSLFAMACHVSVIMKDTEPIVHALHCYKRPCWVPYPARRSAPLLVLSTAKHLCLIGITIPAETSVWLGSRHDRGIMKVLLCVVEQEVFLSAGGVSLSKLTSKSDS